MFADESKQVEIEWYHIAVGDNRYYTSIKENISAISKSKQSHCNISSTISQEPERYVFRSKLDRDGIVDLSFHVSELVILSTHQKRLYCIVLYIYYAYIYIYIFIYIE